MNENMQYGTEHKKNKKKNQRANRRTKQPNETAKSKILLV